MTSGHLRSGPSSIDNTRNNVITRSRSYKTRLMIGAWSSAEDDCSLFVLEDVSIPVCRGCVLLDVPLPPAYCLSSGL